MKEPTSSRCVFVENWLVVDMIMLCKGKLPMGNLEKGINVLELYDHITMS